MEESNREYVKNAIKTESKDFENIAERLSSTRVIRFLHAAMGLVTESAEFVDMLKKHIFYGKPLDMTNAKEEGGDFFWYLAILCDEANISFGEIMEANIKKLKERYGEKFSENKPLNRDTEKERKIIENNIKNV